jgi:tripartite ATP-independent transporter DctM subunit
MHWSLMLLFIFGGVTTLMLGGMPVALAFLLIDIAGIIVFFGPTGLQQLIVSMFSSLATFTLLPLPLFVLMGELLYHSGVGPVIINTVDQWLGRIPGRLSLLAVSAGTLFATLTGTSVGSVAMLGSTLLPDMQRRGYKQPMTIGPIMASGGLAVMIPPSGLAVLLGVIGEVSVGQTLVAIVVPGLLLAFVYAVYIVLRAYLQPSLAPPYEVPKVALHEKMRGLVSYVLPIGIVVFLVIGVIILGIATPSEAAASGVLGTMLLAAYHRRLTLDVLWKSLRSTLEISTMILLIISGATAFGQILALSGASRGLSELAASVQVAPILIIIAMQAVILVMGMFMEVVSIMLITLPIFMPIVKTLGFDPVWFGVLFLVNCEVALISPPFGMSLFVMKAVAPAGTTMSDVYVASVPFVGLIMFVMALIMIFPDIALWLPRIAG